MKDRNTNSTHKRGAGQSLFAAACIIALLFQIFTPSAAVAATTLTPLWTAGGLSAGTDSAGQAYRIATDASGNVAVVSGPSMGRDMAVTSYTADGAFRWRGSVTPSSGTFVGDWVAAAPNGDFVAVGRNTTSRGQPIAITLVRFASDGALQWRVDLARTIPWVGRLLVDSAGNAYLAFNSVGDGQDIQVQKYDPSGALLWSQVIGTGFMANDYATSLAFSPDETDVVVTGNIVGGATWITAAFDSATGTRRWLVTAPEGIAARDVVVDATRVYVTGQGNAGITGYLSVVAYDRVNGAKLWRTDKIASDGTGATGLLISKAPDGSLVVTGQTSRGFLDWYTVAFETTGAVRWEAVRDGGLNTDEIPRGLLVLADGTTVVTGPGGPNLPGGYIQGVTAGYSPDGTLVWEAFSLLATVWVTSLPNGDVCATGGYDALITCWRPSGSPPPNQLPTAVMSANPLSGTVPLTVTFDGSASTDPDGSVAQWLWSFGDGTTGTGAVTTHTYTASGMNYIPALTVVDNRGGSNRITGGPIVVNVPPPPAAPSLLAASISGASVVLTWQDNSSNETAFYIERCQGAGCTSFTNIGFNSANVSTFTDAAVAVGTTYRYRVIALNEGGYSAYSNIASITVGGASSPTPTPLPTSPPTSTPVPPTPTHTPAASTSTGFLSPSANGAQTSSAGDNNGYQTNPGNAYANDSSVASDANSGTNSTSSCSNSGKDKHRYYNFNLNLPAAAVIQGIQVRLDARADAASGSPKLCVQLSWDGGTSWTGVKSTTTLGTAEATYTLGSAADRWGRAWTSSNLSNANFRIRVVDVASSTSRDFFLDYLAVNVTYQP